MTDDEKHDSGDGVPSSNSASSVYEKLNDENTANAFAQSHEQINQLAEQLHQNDSELAKAQQLDKLNNSSIDITAKKLSLKEKIHVSLYEHGFPTSIPPSVQEINSRLKRKIYANWEVPADMFDEKGRPAIIYPRNKIRTTKYTPVSFIPKNLYFQFSNIANSYFLFIVILGAFQIFGVSSPGLAAVPLVVIVCITAIKDALEDYRRAVSDSDLNNSPIHLLVGVNNPNVKLDYVGPWRKFKKGCTKFNHSFFRGCASCFRVFKFGKKKAANRNDNDLSNNTDMRRSQDVPLARVSTVISNLSQRNSLYSHRAHDPTTFIPNTVSDPTIPYTNLAKFKNRRWKDINVGDFIRVRANEEVPADIILLSTSDPEGNCYIETKNLDGETNLKIKNSLHCGQGIKHSKDFENASFYIECDSPNKQLYSFKGVINYKKFESESSTDYKLVTEPITNDSVLLRGSTLRNTKYALGIVVYTGEESKIMLNSGVTPTKTSRIASQLNFSVIFNFLVLFILCFVSGVVNGTFYKKDNVSRLFFEYKPYGKNAATNGVISFFVAVIVYQSLVPISLYISIEIVKTLQAYFIYSDAKMYYEKLDFPCVPKSWSISDDLGQIEYIFSDKTGTLTQNVMEFKKCSINGKSYGLAYTEAQQGNQKRQGIDVVDEADKFKRVSSQDKSEMIDLLETKFPNDQLREDAVTFISSEYVKDILKTGSKQKEANEQFMLALALCHTVVTEDSPDDETYKIFKAESPDEAALVAVARDLGFVFHERRRKSLILDIYGQRKEYNLLEIIPFSSLRKRMSAIIEVKEEDGSKKILLICKGADNVIFQRLAPNSDTELIQKTALHLEDYANEGLRTLCIGQKEIEPAIFENWLERYSVATSSIQDNRQELIDELDEEIEKNLTLLGGTAIEDRLQVGVPDSIAILAKAGVKLWVLTGDKIETAINIGFSCNLLENDMKLLVIRPDDNDPENTAHVENLISSYLGEHFSMSGSLEELKAAKLDHSSPTGSCAVIVDGAALTLIFGGSDDIRRKFLLLCKQCRAVLCCRVSPSQKAAVVKLVKDSLGVMTLAIGDGANDVAMIQSANIGVGIAGEEGRQAVMSSDYAIGQFRFLTRLLLVHGRWSYKRLAEMIPCFFYKNVVFTLTSFWFGIYNNFDGSYLYEYTYLMFYNLAFTSLPVIFLAVFDQDVSDTVSLLVPQLYKSGILRLEWSQYKFFYYMLDGLFQSVISFFFPYLLFHKSFQSAQGLQVDHRFWIGVVSASISVTSCDFYVLLQQYRWDWLTLTIDSISVLFVFFWGGVWSATTNSNEFYKAAAQIYGSLSCWCCFFIAVLINLMPRFTYDFYLKNFKPRDIDIIRERFKFGHFEDYPVGYDPTDFNDIEEHRLLMKSKESGVPSKDPFSNSFPHDDNEANIQNSIASSLYENNREQDAHEAPVTHDDFLRPDSNVFQENGENLEEDEVLDVDTQRHSILSRTFNSIKRHTTLSRSKRNAKSKSSFNFKPPNLNELRLQMMRSGEYGNGRGSLERITTTHDLPGLTQAETLISYHTRNSTTIPR